MGKLLKNRFFVWVGLISYSLYLWHQPIFSFARIRSIAELTVNNYIFLILLAFLFAWISYSWVEKPFRDTEKISPKLMLSSLGLCAAIFLGLGLAGSINHGFPMRFSAEARNVLNYSNSYYKDTRSCWKKLESFKTKEDFCVVGDIAGKPIFGLVGDSHAAVLLKPLEDKLKLSGFSAINYTYNTCLPVINGSYGKASKGKYICDKFREWFYGNLELVPDTLIVLARWPLYLNQDRFDNKEGGKESGGAVRWVLSDQTGSYIDSLKKEYVQFIMRLLRAGKKVVLIHAVPEAGWVVPDRMVQLMRYRSSSLKSDLTTSYKVFQERNKYVEEAFSALPENSNLIHIYPSKVLCNSQVTGRCDLQRNGIPLYYDDDHLSIEGASFVVDEVLKAL